MNAPLQTSVFISYSRKQFYFAESLALHLQKRQVRVWFDFHQLQPSVDWRNSILSAIEACSCLVLVASRDALTSPYVRDEWIKAQSSGKSIYIALFEPVSLPPDLLAAAVIDFRKGFDRGVERLVGCLYGSFFADPAPKPNALGLPLRLPFTVMLPALTLVYSGAVLVLIPLTQIIFSDQDVNVGSVLGACCGLLLLWIAWRYMQRKFTERLLGLTLILLMLGSFMIGSVTLNSGSVPRMRGSPVVGIALMLSAAGALVSITMLQKEDMLRWYPTGEASHWLRATTQGSLMPSSPDQAAARAPTYRLHYAPPDERFAKRIGKILRREGYVEVVDQDTPPDYPILLLSDFTLKQDIAALEQTYDRLVCIVISNVPTSDEWSKLKRYQWIDHRAASNARLHDWLSQLAVGQSEFKLSLLPESFQYRVIPRSVQSALFFLRLLASLDLTLGLLTALGLLGIHPTVALRTLPGLLLLPVGVALFALSDAFANRRVGIKRDLFVSILVSAALIIAGLQTVTQQRAVGIELAVVLLLLLLHSWVIWRTWLPLTSPAEPRLGWKALIQSIRWGTAINFVIVQIAVLLVIFLGMAA